MANSSILDAPAGAHCSAIRTTEPPFRLCAKCRLTRYCSRGWLKADYKIHKKICSQNAAAREHMNNPPRHLSKLVKKPYHKLRDRAWLHDRPRQDVYRMLIDAYRLRMDDEWRSSGQADPKSIYCEGVDSGHDGFHTFIMQADIADVANGSAKLMPHDWNVTDVIECVTQYSMKKEAWSSLSQKINEDYVYEHYRSYSLGQQLRIFA
ncbi:hypothetical protein BJY01DRAFT_250604 [Aspergillus pseudoustus]|uniref:MYND-type domain-containing protein n=1 Tax=Aspergillus pseudoustus TaxID=1810923 RepID=A0ABR4JH51_9EURO